MGRPVKGVLCSTTTSEDISQLLFQVEAVDQAIDNLIIEGASREYSGRFTLGMIFASFVGWRVASRLGKATEIGRYINLVIKN